MRKIFFCIAFLLLSGCLLAQVDIDEQIAALEDSVKVKIERYGENSEEVVNAYFNLYDILFEKAQYLKAFTTAEKCLDVCIELYGVKHSSTKLSYKNLKEVYGVQAFEDIIKIRIEVYGEQHEEVIDAYFDLSKFLYDIGQYQKMNEVSNKCLNICLNMFGENNSKTASNYYNFGLAYYKIEDYAKAIDFFQKAINIYVKVSDNKYRLIATTHNYLGLAYDKVANYSNAIKHYNKSIEIYKYILGDEHKSIGTLYNNVGRIYLETKDYHNALNNFLKVQNIRMKRSEERKPSPSNLYFDISSSYFGLGDLKEGINYSNKASKALRKAIGKKRMIKNPGYSKEKGKLTFENLIVNRKGGAIAHHIYRNQLIKDLQDEYLDSITLQLKIIRQKITEARLLTENELEQKGWNIDTLIEQDFKYSFESIKRLDPRDFVIESIDWQKVQDKLQMGEALIDYFAHYDWVDSVLVYNAMLIKKDKSEPLIIALANTPPVTNLLKIKSHIPKYLKYQDSRIEMYSYIWKEIEEHLENVKTIHIIPDASISKIDFESLQNDKGQYLADLYHFHYYSSCRLFLKKTEDKQQFNDATLYGHIPYYRDHKSIYRAMADSFTMRLTVDSIKILPNTLEEVTVIDSICLRNNISSKLFTIDLANESKIEHFTGIHAPCLIHIATHGTYLPYSYKGSQTDTFHKKIWRQIDNKMISKQQVNPALPLPFEKRLQAIKNPFQRAILFLSTGGETWSNGPNIKSEWDGILTAKEVSQLDLNDTKLVVLSACNSGISSQNINETAYGFPCAFKLAGVDKILVSLWPVEDETTKELMIQFYTNLLQNKQDAATALRNAKTEMRKRNDAPKKWAGFVLVE